VPADFHAANGDRFRVPFMHGKNLLSASRRDDARFVAINLPFAGGRYSMVVLTTRDAPADLASFVDHLSWLDGGQFKRTIDILDLPRFSATSKTELLPLLVGLGLNPFTASSGLSVVTPSLGEVVQKVKLNIVERGAEVVALTEGFHATGSLTAVSPAEVIIDKPFAFSVVDRQSGLIIAAGFVSRIDGEKLAADAPAISARAPPPPQPTQEMRQRAIEQRRALENAVDRARKVQP
jgi:serine protease inhibitor